jgi:hypothetical protein
MNIKTFFYPKARALRKAAILLAFILSLVAICLVGDPSYAGQDGTFKSPSDKIPYAIGIEIARNFKNNGMDLDVDLVVKGLRDGLAGEKLLVSENELRGILISVQSDIRRKRSQAKRGSADSNKKIEEAIK